MSLHRVPAKSLREVPASLANLGRREADLGMLSLSQMCAHTSLGPKTAVPWGATAPLLVPVNILKTGGTSGQDISI